MALTAVSRQLPDVLSRLTGVTRFEEYFDTFCSVPAQWMRLQSSTLTTTNLRALVPLTNLTMLSLGCAGQVYVSTLLALRQLETLQIWEVRTSQHSPLVLAGLRALARLAKLKHLTVVMDTLHTVDDFNTLTQLERLCLCYKNAQPAGQLSSLAQLEELRLYRQGPQDWSLCTALSKLPRLSVVNSASPLVSRPLRGVRSANALQSLKQLNISGYTAEPITGPTGQSFIVTSEPEMITF